MFALHDSWVGSVFCFIMAPASGGATWKTVDGIDGHGEDAFEVIETSPLSLRVVVGVHFPLPHEGVGEVVKRLL